jgi:hypothetical protein
MKLPSTAFNCKADAEVAAAASGVCALVTAVPNANAANADIKAVARILRLENIAPLLWKIVSVIPRSATY